MHIAFVVNIPVIISLEGQLGCQLPHLFSRELVRRVRLQSRGELGDVKAAGTEVGFRL